MIFGRRKGRTPDPSGPDPFAAAAADLDQSALEELFAAPRWLQRLGRQAWLLVGLGVVVVGFVWVLGIASTIVLPVAAASIVAAVLSPLVGALQRRHIPRAGGAGLLMLAVLAVAILIAAVVVSSIVDQWSSVEATAKNAATTIQGWFDDAGASGTSGPTADTSADVQQIGSTLLQGVANGISGLTSLAFFLSFFLFSTFFLLKDGPVIRRWVDRHLGIPQPLARVVTGRVVESMRNYFVGVSIVAAFNGIVVYTAALILDVPSAGAIGVITVAGAYVPFIGAFVSGAFAVVITLGALGTQEAIIMLIVVILANGALQQIVQPLAFGAALDLNPLAVLVLTISGGALFGMVGLILAAPLASAVVHIARDVASARASVAQAPPVAGAEPSGAPPGG